MTDQTRSPQDADAEPTPGSPESQGPLIYRSDELLQGRRQVFIEHGNEMYRLRLTASGKLYLTK